ncbi:Oocyte zinc finger protein XlCOF26-like protein [Argiope bruennichi]|uniref:Oocyte zinc finger protein XlCOF26-like protein n=1 Tax=Argiope bruennichi TaxID=94029 RepID=A0A8T0ESL6_ARGBR|nr:Oocyte zinc finger protein XlCOF26-like protein [Argiope bruennichi]
MTVLETREAHLFRIAEHPPTCPSCGETFSYRYQLEFHFKWKHRDSGSIFICSDCNESSTEEHKFKLHISKHGKIMRHTCEKCGFRFVTELELKMHQLIHRKVTRKQGAVDICSHLPAAIPDLAESEVTLQETIAAPCRGCFSRQSFSVRHSRKNRFSECSYVTCIKQKVCAHGNRWTHSL